MHRDHKIEGPGCHPGLTASQAAGVRSGGIAHGFLILSMSRFLREHAEGVAVRLPSKMAINYGLNRVRFPAPVRVGKRIRARTKLLGVEDVSSEAYQAAYEITVQVEGEPRPALVAEQLVRWYF